MATLEWIPLSSITKSVYQPRLQEDRELHELVESILENGLLTVIVVLPAGKQGAAKGGKQGGDPTYLMFSGHRRRAALLVLAKRKVERLPRGHARIGAGGGVEVQALVDDQLDPRDAALATVVENEERQRLTPYELACAVKHLVKERKFTIEQVAKRTRKTEEDVYYMISALSSKNLPIMMINSWKERRLEFGHIKVLYRLRDERELQMKLYQKILKENLAVSDARFYCTLWMDASKLPLAHREYKLIKKRLIANPLLKQLIDNKQLRLEISTFGGKVELRVDGATRLREAAEAIASALEGLDL